MSEAVMAELKKLSATIEGQGKEIANLKQKSASNPDPKRVFGIRKGEDTMSSRPYSFLKAFGLYKGQLTADECTVEVDISNRLRKHLVNNGYEKSNDKNLMIPFWTQGLGEDAESQSFAREIKSLVKGADADDDEIAYLRKHYYQKDLSWVTDTTGGTLVPLAAQGELVELLRNKEALIKAGASTFPLPPQGSISFPKQTSAMSANWVGEKQTVPKTDIGTGSVLLKAKKLAARGSIPNELFRYSNPAADAIVRNDIARAMALAMDLAGLQGTGGLQPTGLISLTGAQAIGTYTASKTATDGNTFQPQDWSKILGVIENNNGIINENTVAFIARPKFYRFTDPFRADAVSAGDAAGTFVEMMKMANEKQQPTKYGYPVVLSNQVSGARTKGSGTTLSYVLAGDFSQLLIGMGAVMELDMNPFGDTPWQTDQTEIRGILQCDIAVRHSESFAWCDQLLQA